ncbi:hypothetical protein A5647_01890 [Mycobacterium sp. 1100029.7]|nr:hypothetical protein A5647_01890 [Mycobacterium sp. 1100029.7]
MNYPHGWLLGLSFALGFVLTLASLRRRAVKGTDVEGNSSAVDPPTTKFIADPPTTRVVLDSPTTAIPANIESRTTKIPVPKPFALKQVSPVRETATTKIPVPPPAPFGPGSAHPDPDGRGPAGWLVKAQSDTRLYYTPDNPSYDATVAQVWFKDENSALRAGFTPWHST